MANANFMDWFDLSSAEIYKKLGSTEHGLTSAEAEKRQARFGLNELRAKKGGQLIRMVINQFSSSIIWILLFAFVFSLILGGYIDAVVIGSIIVLNAILGFIHEYKAEKAVEALKRLATPTTTVLRNGARRQIDARQLVPGDVVLLEAGATVPADCYLLHDVALRADESTLTGESVPVNKTVGVVPGGSGLIAQSNMLFASTIVTTGRAMAMVVAIGMQTEIGRIAKIIEVGENKQTPLQEKLAKFGRKLGFLVIALCVVIFIVGVIIGYSLDEIFLTTIALAVAAVPEGLPAVVTICLALGVQKMIKKNVLIRRLSAVETLGSTTVICTDKTGTLTRNQMTVRRIYAAGKEIDVSGDGYDRQGVFLLGNKKFDVKKINNLLRAAVQCNDASIMDGQLLGDPTEIALLILGAKAGVKPSENRLTEKPFDSVDKYMSTVNEAAGERRLYVKGALEAILPMCRTMEAENGDQVLAAEHSARLFAVGERFADQALRVLGFAYSPTGEEKDLIFLGLVGMIDPPREGVKDSIARCRQAGIRVAMLTGDHVLTARAIGRLIGIEGAAISGEDIDRMSDKQLAAAIDTINIFARVSPEHKVKILQAVQKKNNIVAMTGDGVNDAPALKRADIGVAVTTSTDVAKEAADMILTDGHFSSIVGAIEEGRQIYANIRRFIKFLLSCNLGELMTFFFCVVLGLGEPLLAVQILWMNLITDGLPALALSAEPLSKRVMRLPPRDPKENILNRAVASEIFFIGALMTVIAVLVFNRFRADLAYAQTMVFTCLVFLQLLNGYGSRTGSSIFKLNPFSNWKMLLAIAISAVLQLIVVYTPLGYFFRTVPLSGGDLGLAAAASLLVIVGLEAWKFVRAKFFDHRNLYKY